MLKNKLDKSVIQLFEQFTINQVISFRKLYKDFGKSTFYDTMKKVKEIEESIQIQIFTIKTEKYKHSYRKFLENQSKIEFLKESPKNTMIKITSEETQ